MISNRKWKVIITTMNMKSIQTTIIIKIKNKPKLTKAETMVLKRQNRGKIKRKLFINNIQIVIWMAILISSLINKKFL